MIIEICILLIVLCLLVMLVFFQLCTKDVQVSIIIKKILLLVVVTVMLTLLFFVRGWINISIQIDPAGEHAWLYYRYGPVFEGNLSERLLNETGSVSFTIPADMDVKQLMLDPMESEGTFLITGLQINVLNYRLVEYTPEEIFQDITVKEGEATLSAQGVQITSSGPNLIILSGEGLTKALNDCLNWHIGICTAVLLLIGLAMFFVLRRPVILRFLEKVINAIKPSIENIGFDIHFAIAAVVHFLICFHIQHSNFTFAVQHVNRIIAYETAFFIILQILWQVLGRVLYKVKRKDHDTLEFLKFSGIYFCIMIFMLLMVWPGYYVTDEYAMLYSGTQWNIISAYHFLMQGYLVLSQMLIPGAAGAEIVQIAIISTIVGYVFQQIYHRFLPSKWIYLLYIPLSFPAVLLNNLQWQKSIPGTYLEVLLLSKILFAAMDRRKLRYRDVIEWTLLTAVTFTLRMDGFYYLVAAPVIVFFIFRKTEKRSLLAVFAVGTVVCGLVLQNINNSGHVKKLYTLVNYTRLGYAAITAADPVKDGEELDALNHVFDVDLYRTAADQNAATATVPIDVLVGTIDDAELSSFQSSVMKLIIKHPLSHIRQQMECFLRSSGFDAYIKKSYTGNGGNNNYQNPDTSQWGDVLRANQHVQDIDSNPLNSPFNQSLRLHTILFCMGRDVNNYLNVGRRDLLFNNLIPALFFLLGLWVCFLIKRQYVLLSILTLFLLRWPILIASASYVSFQYHLRFFVVGNMIPFFIAARLFTGRHKPQQERIE